jgi:hypothetical protein
MSKGFGKVERAILEIFKENSPVKELDLHIKEQRKKNEHGVDQRAQKIKSHVKSQVIMYDGRTRWINAI